MRMQLRQYIINLYQEVPMGIYEGLLSILCFGIVLMVSVYGFKKGLKLSSVLLLFEYLFLLFCSTVFIRESAETQGYNFSLFWSYYAYDKVKRPDLLPEIIMNVMVFVPIGLLLGCAYRNLKWWMVVLIGVCVSALIEALQYFLKRGFAETDDVMHNLLGCLVGYGIYKLVRGLWLKR